MACRKPPRRRAPAAAAASWRSPSTIPPRRPGRGSSPARRVDTQPPAAGRGAERRRPPRSRWSRSRWC
eukprot:6854854-Pyramimonas_sp.AAC.1